MASQHPALFIAKLPVVPESTMAVVALGLVVRGLDVGGEGADRLI